MSAKPTFWEFAKALISNWFSGMSGAASVPLTVGAFWFTSDWAKAALATTAFICVWLAAYSVWKDEREKVVQLEEDAAIPERDAWLQDAIYFHVHGRWPAPGDRLFDPMLDSESSNEWLDRIKNSDDARKVEQALLDFHQAAIDEKIGVWGRPDARKVLNMLIEPDPSALFERIPSSHWQHCRVKLELLAGKPEQAYTTGKADGLAVAPYSICSPMVSKSQIERLWGRCWDYP